MGLIINFVLGFTTSFLGTITPGMLNMATAKITLEKTKQEGKKFAFGVSVIALIQAYIALIFAEIISNNLNFRWYFKAVGVFAFAGISFYFFRKAINEHKQKAASKYKINNSFVVGLILSSLNMFAVLFYSAVITTLHVVGWFEFSQVNILLFVLGSSLGTYSLLYMYASNAKKIEAKARIITKNINFILGFVTGAIAIITFIRLI